MPKFRARQSRRLSRVVVQKAAHPFAANDCAATSEVCGAAGDQGVVQPLMVAFLMIVSHIFRDCPTEMPLAERHDSIETLRLDRKNKSFREGVQIRTPRRQSHNLHTARLQGFSERLRGRAFSCPPSSAGYDPNTRCIRTPGKGIALAGVELVQTTKTSVSRYPTVNWPLLQPRHKCALPTGVPFLIFTLLMTNSFLIRKSGRLTAGEQTMADFERRSDHRAFVPRSSPRESNPRLHLRRSNRYLRHRPFSFCFGRMYRP